jgi:hypothetical protein
VANGEEEEHLALSAPRLCTLLKLFNLKKSPIMWSASNALPARKRPMLLTLLSTKTKSTASNASPA